MVNIEPRPGVLRTSMLPLVDSASKSPLRSVTVSSPLTDLICTSPSSPRAVTSPESVPTSMRSATSSILMSPLCVRASTEPFVPLIEMSPDCAPATMRTPTGTLTSKRASPLRYDDESSSVTRELPASSRTFSRSLEAWMRIWSLDHPVTMMSPALSRGRTRGDLAAALRRSPRARAAAAEPTRKREGDEKRGLSCPHPSGPRRQQRRRPQ